MITEVHLPAELLGHQTLTASTKVLWGVLQLMRLEKQRKMTVRGLARQSGMSRETIRHGLEHLEATGWATGDAPNRYGMRPWQVKGGAGRAAALPVELLLAPDISSQPKVVYACLRLVPGYGPPGNRVVFSDDRVRYTLQLDYPGGLVWHLEIGERAAISRHTARRALQVLRRNGWVDLSREHKYRPLRFQLRNLIRETDLAAVARAKRYVKQAPFKGEALMRLYLSLLVDSAEYADNTSPRIILNPLTEEQFHFDRYYYKAGVAFEFNGPQHYGPTEKYSREEYQKQRARDRLKKILSEEAGVTVVVVRPKDLSLERMREKVSGLLPLRDLYGCAYQIAYLESRSKQYRQRAAGLG